MNDEEFDDYKEILDSNFKGGRIYTPKSLVHQIYELNKKVEQPTRERDNWREQTAIARVVLDGTTDLLEAAEDDRKAAIEKADKLQEENERLRRIIQHRGIVIG